MREATTSNGIKIEWNGLYFVFNKCIVKITSTGTDKVQSLRYRFGTVFLDIDAIDGNVEFDISGLLQSIFNRDDFHNVKNYDDVLFKVYSDTSIIFKTTNYPNGMSWGNMMISCIYGALDKNQYYERLPVGQGTQDEYLRQDIKCIKFSGYPFTIGTYFTSGNLQKYLIYDATSFESVNMESGKWNVFINNIPEGTRKVYFLCVFSGALTSDSVFDNTFDFTFKNIDESKICTKYEIDLKSCVFSNPVYLRWINKNGFYCYWLFDTLSDSMEVDEYDEHVLCEYDGFKRDDNYITPLKQTIKKSSAKNISLAYPLLDKKYILYVYSLTESMFVNKFNGYDSEGHEIWEYVRIESGRFSRNTDNLQDFACNMIIDNVGSQKI